MPEKITILKESGETLVSNIVSIFTIPETEKRYIITTENAVDPHGLTVLHVSEIVDGTMQKIATDDEWSSIKTIMRAIISGNVGSYKYLPVEANLKATSQYSRDISVSASASKQMIDNYNAGEKSAVSTPAPDANVATAPEAANPEITVNPSSIFPTDGAVVSNDDELVPGIAEVPNTPSNGVAPLNASPTPVVPATPVPEQPAPVPEIVPTPVVSPVSEVVAPTPVVVPTPEVVPTPVVNPTPEAVVPTPVVTPTPVVAPEAVVPPVVPATPTPVPEVVQPVPSVVSVPEPVAPVVVPSVAPVVEPVNPQLNNSEATPVNVAVTPVIDAQVNPPVGVVPTTVAPEQPVNVNNLGLTNDVQVATPVVIPDAQIVQNAQNTSLTTDEQINFNAAPSFDPNATLDEVVVAAQQMFMEGVKNLVVTIQEKVYRDLYSKEEELKNREAAIAQKEQAMGINQVATPEVATPVNLGGGTAPQPVVQPQPTPVAQPIIQPTVVQATNDVI